MEVKSYTALTHKRPKKGDYFKRSFTKGSI